MQPELFKNFVQCDESDNIVTFYQRYFKCLHFSELHLLML
jgi:hypothetical protein